MNKSVLILALIIASQATNVCAEVAHNGICGEGCTYTLEDGVLTVSGTGSVAKIDDGAFHNNLFSTATPIKKIVIEDGIKEIGTWAFSNQPELESVSTPASLSKIGDYSFSGCSKLSNVQFSEGLEDIRSGAFRNTKLQEVKLPQSLDKIGPDAFQDTELSSIDIPSQVTNIGQFAFESTNISTVEIPSAVTFIGVHAFDTENMKMVYCTQTQIRNKICSSDSNKKFGDAGIGSYSKNNDESTAYYGSDGKLKGFKNKRIYTIEEAMAISKPTGNRFRIRYK